MKISPYIFFSEFYSFSQYHLLKRLVIIMCPCRFIGCNPCTALVGAVDNVRGYTRSRCGEYMGNLYLPLDFAVTLGTALENKVYYKKKKKKAVLFLLNGLDTLVENHLTA